MISVRACLSSRQQRLSVPVDILSDVGCMSCGKSFSGGDVVSAIPFGT